MILSLTLNRLGRTVRDTLNMIHDLAEHRIGARDLADPIRVDSTKPDDPMSQLALAMLELFGLMGRTYAIYPAAHAWTLATSKGNKATGLPTSTRPNLPTPRASAIQDYRYPKLWIKQESPDLACTATCHRGHRDL